jgi:hypothetical protein
MRADFTAASEVKHRSAMKSKGREVRARESSADGMSAILQEKLKKTEETRLWSG